MMQSAAAIGGMWQLLDDSDIRRSHAVQCLVDSQAQFESYTLGHRQPVTLVSQDRCDAIIYFRTPVMMRATA